VTIDEQLSDIMNIRRLKFAGVRPARSDMNCVLEGNKPSHGRPSKTEDVANNIHRRP